MSDIIQLLPDTVANQIAAGEVIQRPASVVKELVENAVDAGATMVNVVCVDSGRTSVQVVDNGKGMSETDARLSFERHATSKIRKAADLFALHTMGFRGEALASIAAVAQVTLRTRQDTDDIGTQLTIEGSDFKGQEACSCPVGSNFMVENLFYNVPVRRKFLKSNTTELDNIVTAFERIALVNPAVAFTLHNNGTELYNLKQGSVRQRIVDVFGKKINQFLLPLDVDTSVCKISGFVAKPESSRKKGARQYFFVNGRFMKHPYFHKAVMMAYERLIPESEQVSYFIYFTVKPEDIDVNIHPTKTEIKFENEQTIWQILTATVKETLGMFNDATSIEFDTEGRPDIPVFNPSDDVELPKVQYNPNYNPFEESSSVPRQHAAPKQWEQLYDGLKQQPVASQTLFDADEDETFAAAAQPSYGEVFVPGVSNPIEEKSPAHYQYKGKYIMTAVKSGLMIIDQNRAHLRILYEQFLEQLRNKKAYPQKVLFPETVHFSQSDNVVLQKIMPELEVVGFELTSLGGASYSINSVPSGLDGVNYVDLVQDLVSAATEHGTNAIDDINHSVALGLASHAAVDYGQVLTNSEMEAIVNDLFACSNFNYAPDGRKILCILKQSELEHLLS